MSNKMDGMEQVMKLAAQVNSANIHEDIFKKILENTFSVLAGKPEIHSMNTLYNSKPDAVKGVYGALLTISAEFGRHNFDKESVRSFLVNNCNFNAARATLYADLYDKKKQGLENALGKIGSNLPHLTDVQWKIDYIVKSSNIDQAEGPLFRICLVAEGYDQDSGDRKTEYIKFSCNSQELQDLVYKLKDAVKHCQKLVTDH